MSSTQPPRSLLDYDEYVTRRQRNEYIRILNSIMSTSRDNMTAKETDAINEYIEMLQVPTSSHRYISWVDREAIHGMMTKYWGDIHFESPTSTPDETISVTLSVPKKQLSSFIESLHITSLRNGSFSFLTNEIEKLRQEHHLPILQLSVLDLLSEVEGEIGEPIPHRDTWIRLFNRSNATIRTNSHDNILPLFYAETEKLRAELNQKNFSSQDATEIRDIISWVYLNVPEVDEVRLVWDRYKEGKFEAYQITEGHGDAEESKNL